MKTLISIVIFILLQSSVGISQSCVGFVQYKSNTICVEQIISTAPGVPLNNLPSEFSQRQDIQFFQKYFTHSSLQEYQNLFKQSDWYGLSEEEYLQWKENIKLYPITVEGLVTFWQDNTLWSAIQYYSIQNSQYARSSLLIKRIGQKWYPASLNDEEQMKSIKSVFRDIRPEFFQYAFQTGQMISIPEGFSKMKAAVMKGNTLNANTLNTESKSLSPNAIENVRYNLKERVNPEADFARDRLHDSEMTTYMDSLGISQADQLMILDQIKSFDYVKAGVKIAQLTNDPINFPPHIDAIRRIYGDDRIRKAQAD